jgi:hypothetical protein
MNHAGARRTRRTLSVISPRLSPTPGSPERRTSRTPTFAALLPTFLSSRSGRPQVVGCRRSSTPNESRGDAENMEGAEAARAPSLPKSSRYVRAARAAHNESNTYTCRAPSSPPARSPVSGRLQAVGRRPQSTPPHMHHAETRRARGSRGSKGSISPPRRLATHKAARASDKSDAYASTPDLVDLLHVDCQAVGCRPSSTQLQMNHAETRRAPRTRSSKGSLSLTGLLATYKAARAPDESDAYSSTSDVVLLLT